MSQVVAAGRAGRSRRFRSSYRLGQRVTSLVALFGMLWYAAVPAGAADNVWTATADLNWETLLNWSLGAKPVATDDVVFPTPIPNPLTLPNPNVITLSSGEVAQSLTFQADTYQLTGGDLTLGPAGNITVGPTFTATINSTLAGPGGITLAANNGLVAPDAQVGGGTLVLGGTNTYSGVTTINSGVLSVSSAANLGDGSATNTVAIEGGGVLRNTGATVDLGGNRAVQIGTGGGAIDVTGTNSLTVSGVLSSAAGNTLTKTGSGTLVLGGTAANLNAGAVKVVQGAVN